jgi:hypothetical protein
MDRSGVISFSLLNVTGPLDEDTPHIVLQEIAEVHGVALKCKTLLGTTFVLSDLISSVKPFTFHRPLLVEELPSAASFINSSVLWPSESLEAALSFVMFFAIHPGFPPLGDTVYGKPLPSYPTSFTACMLYRLLKIRGIRIHIHCTLQHLANAVTIAYRTPDQTRALVYSAIIHNLDSSQLSSLYSNHIGLQNLPDPSLQIPEVMKPVSSYRDNHTFISSSASSSYSDLEDIRLITEELEDDQDNDEIPLMPNVRPMQISAANYESLQDVCDLLGDQDYVMKRLAPTNASEAICLAAINFSIDLSSSLDPSVEYGHLLSNPIGYVPRDTLLKRIWEINPRLIRLDIHFNPLLPPEMYAEDSIRRLAIFEGFTDLDLRSESAYSLLQTASYTESFHEGKHRLIQNQETLEGDSIDELPPSLVVCFGLVGSGVYAFRYRELTQTFKRERCFKNPTERSLFSSSAIGKLKNICKLVHPGEAVSCFQERAQLLDCMAYVEIINDEACVKIKELYEIYQITGETGKNNIRAAIKLLMDMGMYMRGWNGRDSYPVELCLVSNQIEVDVKVTEAIALFEETCSNLGATGQIILNLPLLKYFNKAYIISNNDHEGTTIGARVAIVKGGENLDASFSCIRLSSNWICSTAYRVMQILGMLPSFQIDKLRHIS